MVEEEPERVGVWRVPTLAPALAKAGPTDTINQSCRCLAGVFVWDPDYDGQSCSDDNDVGFNLIINSSF